jgi:hypothetical protein
MRRVLILLLSGLMAGCNLILDNPEPREARLVIDGEAGKPIRIITSTEFVAAVNEIGQTRVQVFVADTIFTTLPYQRTFRIDDDHRYFAEAARLDSDLDELHMQVYIDDRKQFDQGGILIDGQPYRFVYAFNQMVTREIVIL